MVTAWLRTRLSFVDMMPRECFGWGYHASCTSRRSSRSRSQRCSPRRVARARSEAVAVAASRVRRRVRALRLLRLHGELRGRARLPQGRLCRRVPHAAVRACQGVRRRDAVRVPDRCALALRVPSQPPSRAQSNPVPRSRRAAAADARADGVLFEWYKQGRHNFEVIECVRRLALSSAVASSKPRNDSAPSRSSSRSVPSTGFEAQPFRDAHTDAFGVGAGYAIVFTYLVALVLVADLFAKRTPKASGSASRCSSSALHAFVLVGRARMRCARARRALGSNIRKESSRQRTALSSAQTRRFRQSCSNSPSRCSMSSPSCRARGTRGGGRRRGLRTSWPSM